jgi:hypothetical protein
MNEIRLFGLWHLDSSFQSPPFYPPGSHLILNWEKDAILLQIKKMTVFTHANKQKSDTLNKSFRLLTSPGDWVHRSSPPTF